MDLLNVVLDNPYNAKLLAGNENTDARTGERDVILLRKARYERKDAQLVPHY